MRCALFSLALLLCACSPAVSIKATVSSPDAAADSDAGSVQDIARSAPDAADGVQGSADADAGNGQKDCTPGKTTCLDDKTAGYCMPDGTWSKTACLVCMGESCCGLGPKQCYYGNVAQGACGVTMVVAENCAAKGQTCVNAACVIKVCEPGQVFCDGSKQVKCDATGATSALVFDCMALQSEQSTCLGGKCVPVKCTAGTISCADMATLATCKAGGADYDTTPCGEGKGCDGGKCAVLVCNPGEHVCVGAQVATCNAAGTQLVPTDDCASKKQKCVLGACKSVAPDGMVFIPSGSFNMGCVPGDSDCNSDEKPRHAVTLAAYYMDVYEVTVAKYKACVDAGNCTAPYTGSSMNSCNWGVAGREQHPVNCVDWAQADAFCKWMDAKGHLPTEAQWERAARGGLDGKKYPWGDSLTCAEAVWSGGSSAGCDGSSTLPVGSKSAGKNGYGLYDMAGNVWEWTADWYGSYGSSPGTDPTGPGSGSYRVFRGGSFYIGAYYMRASVRGDFSPSEYGGSLGFRCARSYP